MSAALDARDEHLARRLADAWRDGTLLEAPDDGAGPLESGAAYAVQHRVLALRGQRIAGWKVGSKSPDGPIQCAPLPADGLLASPATVERARYPTCGLELEIAFRFACRLEPGAPDLGDAAVLAGIGSMAAAIEIVATRYAGWPAVPRLAQLADLQNHGALVVGAWTDYRADFPFETPTSRFELDGRDIRLGDSNPAGDPRRLLPWLVRHALAAGLAIEPGTVITTGSCTGMHFARGPGSVLGRIEGLPPVRLKLM